MIHSSAKSAILMRNWNLGEGNMGFTIGDIIVLLVVVVILAVYRQTDRNNRSLDKVKRFVERVQGEMDEIVAEKVTMLKDIGIEVDVHQKAAKEVLKRIQSIEDDLNSRTGSLEEIGARLTEYEQALSRLVEMTQRTEENIERVRDESEYVDKVGKRIKATQGKIEELERSLPGIVSGFEKQNDERLAELETRVLASTEKRVAELSGRIDGAGTRVQEFQEEVVRLQGETEERAVAS
ncbi:MAG: SpiroCoCo family coiled-coil protein, partial [Alkalispirochaeta sp.]